MKKLLIILALLLIPFSGAFGFDDASILLAKLNIPDNQLAWMFISHSEETGGGGTTCSGDYGDTSTSSTSHTPNDSGFIVICRIPLGCNGIIDELNAYMDDVDSVNREVHFLLYHDNGSGTDPAGFIWSCGKNDNTTSVPAWIYRVNSCYEVTGSPSFIWSGVQFEADADMEIFYDAGSMECRTYSGTWEDPPDPWPTASDTAYSDRAYSINITFNP